MAPVKEAYSVPVKKSVWPTMPGLTPGPCGPGHSGTVVGMPWVERGDPTDDDGAEGTEAVERLDDGRRSSWYMGGDMRPGYR